MPALPLAGAPRMDRFTHHFHPSILREYDIRGIFGETLSVGDAYAIGRAFASFPAAEPIRRVCVGYDGRKSSPVLEEALCHGLRDAGMEVTRIGLGPTPQLYYAVRALGMDGGIMVTGSHNPPAHNGFKFMLGKAPFYGKDIKELGRIAASGEVKEGEGVIREQAVQDAYVQELLSAYRGARALKVAWDAGNGAAGPVMQALCARLPGEHTALFAEVDGTFPNHHPDPSVAKNLAALIQTVREKRCDLGLAFDGDGDRVGVVDDQGQVIWGDQLMMLFAQDVLAEHPGATIIADVKSSQLLFDEITRLGGDALMWKTGHSHIKAKMAENGAKLAGELTGHVFFADRYYGFDDGLYAAIRLLSIAASRKEPLSQFVASLPKSFTSPEIRFHCKEERKFVVIEEVKARLLSAKADVCDVDGVRVTTKDGWWLLRASNTGAELGVRWEAKHQAGLSRLEEAVRSALAQSGVELP